MDNIIIFQSHEAVLFKAAETVWRAGGTEDRDIIWVSTVKDLADEYEAENYSSISYTINVNNPIDIRKSETERTMREFVTEIIEHAYSTGIDLDEAEGVATALMRKETDKLPLHELWDSYPKEIRALLASLGYDSIKTTEGGHNTYGVFDRESLIELSLL